MATTPEAPPSPPLPLSLRVAALLLAAEALGILAIGGWLLVGTLTEDRQGVAIGLSSALFIMLAGLGVALLSYGTWRINMWTRGPATLAQFLLLPIGWQLLPAPTTLAGLGSIVLAIATLVLIFLPTSSRAFLAAQEHRAALAAGDADHPGQGDAATGRREGDRLF